MTFLNPIPVTVLVAAKNEEVNLARCLAALSPAQRVIVLDSHSSDGTARIARECGCEVVQFDFRGGYPKKRQWALDTLEFSTNWILLLDADERVPESLWREIESAIANPHAPDAFLITKGFHFLKRKFRFGGFSHAAVLLFRKGQARFERIHSGPKSAPDMEVHERLIIRGRMGKLRTPLIHEDFKGLHAYLARHNDYSSWEANVRFQYLTQGAYGQETIEGRLFGNTQERRRFLKKLAMHMPGEPWGWFLYHYLFRLGFLEGMPGFIAASIRAHYIRQVRAKMSELAQHQHTSKSGYSRPKNVPGLKPTDRVISPNPNR